MSLSIDQVRKVATLARLELGDADLAQAAVHLSAILEYVEQLSQLNTDGVEPMAHPLPVQNVFRADEPGVCLTPDEALANAPVRYGDYFGVPAVFDSDEPVSH
ncbi:MAG TPA: Asp-tRNA(Asn)/Glu-tRNA(Gln) amidotransferase subunit GatC [Fimbriiglobus sp.]|jgi:aspartyl-tRNA(Asn)/glutamyl-tRNA(Gln) amidotransferase subunit C